MATFRRPVCNCPDASQKRSPDPYATSQSGFDLADWSATATGIRDTGGYCIHELAVLRARGEMKLAFPNGVPNDLPSLPPDTIPLRREIKTQDNPLMGDDVSGGINEL